MHHRVLTRLRALAAERRGVALIEWAISLPVLLALGLGGIEIANYAMANLRISQIAMTTADNAGRVRDEITESDVNELLEGAKFVGRGLGFAANGRVILSDVERTSAGRQWMRWQRCAGALNATSSYGVPMDKNGAAITNLGNAASAPTDYGAVADKWTATAVGPAGNQIATGSGTAMMLVEIVYDYQPLFSTRYLGGDKTMRYTGAFNVRQRTDHTLKRGSVATAKISSCGTFSA